HSIHQGRAIICLGIKLSAITLQRGSWWRSIVAMLRRAPHLAKRLIIEVTEITRIVDDDDAVVLLQELRGLGCKIAQDDLTPGVGAARQVEQGFLIGGPSIFPSYLSMPIIVGDWCTPQGDLR